MRNPLSLVRTAVRDPDRIIPFLKRRFTDVNHGIRYRNTPRQKSKIHDFVDQTDFVLVILDACRFDCFAEQVGEYLEGDLEMVYTPTTATIDYVQNTWDGQYDLTYVTGIPAPTDYAFERKGLDYRPESHFEEFVHVWKLCDDKELGAVPPEAVTAATLETDAKRTVAHYVQPHAPYIGDYRLRDGDGETEWSESLSDVYEKIGRYDPETKEISDLELRKAYRSNLTRVLESVQDLVETVDRPVVVTADHGELLGEDGRYIHGNPKHPILCEVPWFVVEGSVDGTRIDSERSSIEATDSEFTDRDVEEQLEKLGYV